MGRLMFRVDMLTLYGYLVGRFTRLYIPEFRPGSDTHRFSFFFFQPPEGLGEWYLMSDDYLFYTDSSHSHLAAENRANHAAICRHLDAMYGVQSKPVIFNGCTHHSTPFNCPTYLATEMGYSMSPTPTPVQVLPGAPLEAPAEATASVASAPVQTLVVSHRGLTTSQIGDFLRDARHYIYNDSLWSRDPKVLSATLVTKKIDHVCERGDIRIEYEYMTGKMHVYIDPRTCSYRVNGTRVSISNGRCIFVREGA